LARRLQLSPLELCSAVLFRTGRRLGS
jgi:hypothetical protein